LTKFGHEVRLMPAKDVKAYVKRNKNDAADAEAICEAVRRPTPLLMRVLTPSTPQHLEPRHRISLANTGPEKKTSPMRPGLRLKLLSAFCRGGSIPA
jgi:hypothetical protein